MKKYMSVILTLALCLGVFAGCGKKEEAAADRLATDRDMLSRMTGSLSFGLLMTSLGLCVILTVVIVHVF